MFAWISFFFVCKGCWYQFYHHLVTVHVLKVFYKGLNLLLSELNVFLQFLHENLSFLFTRTVDTNFIIILLQLMFQRFFYNMFSTCCSQNWIFASFFVGKGYWYKFWDDLDKKKSWKLWQMFSYKYISWLLPPLQYNYMWWVWASKFNWCNNYNTEPFKSAEWHELFVIRIRDSIDFGVNR